jgi:Arc/MetJ-type ribon-helix-helix transcriptional regulator
MKNLNVVITEEADAKLEKVMVEKRFKNRADAVNWIIDAVFALVFGKEVS